jgi:plasmid stabilization system protein ParE
MGRRNETNSQTNSLRISSEALLDIQATIRHIAYFNGQPINASKVFIEIHKTIHRIARNPYAFRECEELPTITKIYRRANCLSWTIVYRILKSEILVLGVVHRAGKASRIRALRKRK